MTSIHIIKTRTEIHCALRENNYGCTFAHALRLVEEAKRDFPTLADDEIQIVKYGGIYYAHQMGVEFRIPSDASPALADYELVAQLEVTV